MKGKKDIQYWEEQLMMNFTLNLMLQQLSELNLK